MHRTNDEPVDQNTWSSERLTRYKQALAQGISIAERVAHDLRVADHAADLDVFLVMLNVAAGYANALGAQLACTLAEVGIDCIRRMDDVFDAASKVHTRPALLDSMLPPPLPPPPPEEPERKTLHKYEAYSTELQTRTMEILADSPEEALRYALNPDNAQRWKPHEAEGYGVTIVEAGSGIALLHELEVDSVQGTAASQT